MTGVGVSAAFFWHFFSSSAFGFLSDFDLDLRISDFQLRPGKVNPIQSTSLTGLGHSGRQRVWNDSHAPWVHVTAPASSNDRLRAGCQVHLNDSSVIPAISYIRASWVNSVRITDNK